VVPVLTARIRQVEATNTPPGMVENMVIKFSMMKKQLNYFYKMYSRQVMVQFNRMDI